ncbi:MAG TPA: hypothetical protein VM510_15290 [Caulifigura sp.]|nr:hypothetical protein [Caulifigura sp.]
MSLGRLLAYVTLFLVAAVSVRGDDIDWNRARELHRKASSGEKLTAEEQAYYDRARAERAKSQGAGPKSAPAAAASLGLVPLTDMTASDRYKGEDGGLYGGGRNEPPEAHRKAALDLARRIEPLDADGKPSKDGVIGLVSIGMSNTTQEYSEFMRLANRDADKSPKVVLVDGAQGGMDSQAWATPKGNRNPWEVLDKRLQQANVSARQVQVVWLKQAHIAPAALGEYPKHAEKLAGDIELILHGLAERFPNLRIAYLSSRIYAGNASTALNPEPFSYESAFAVRRLIQKQVAGDASLNFDARNGAVRSPLLLWGPYLWADGVKGRKPDELVWLREDMAGDGTHPGPSGQRKVAELLLKFFKTDETAKGWFVGAQSPSR